MNARRLSLRLLLGAAGACGGGDRSRSPTCGMAQLIGPSLILEQLKQSPYVLTDAPRGLPSSLPARVVGAASQATVSVRYDGRHLTMAYPGANFPVHPTDAFVFALLVVDDSTQRAEGVLLYEAPRPPPSYPQLGSVTGGDATIPLYGVRVDWRSVNNPGCPLLGAAAAPGTPGPAPSPPPTRSPAPRP
ncbi:MAG TPA: hypothetical protein VH158_05660 [Gemmatimonadales bacterium]|nr:hypothetical protein [Gemmatimonadales bacterium]